MIDNILGHQEKIHEIVLEVYDSGWHGINDQTQHRKYIRSLDIDPARDRVIFNVREGVSLYYHGVIDFISTWQKETGHDNQLISISCWNPCETYPWNNLRKGPSRSFLKMIQEGAKFENTINLDPNYVFGLFIGRITAPRLCIMHHMNTNYAASTLISHYTDGNLNGKAVTSILQNQSDRFSKYHEETVKNWYMSNRPKSIDGADFNAALSLTSLLKYYHQFQIDIVAETMTKGSTFIPTEKIARPLAMSKPFLVFGAKNFLQNLKRLGFKTYDTLWDESYDQFELEERWDRMLKVIDHISSLPQTQQDDLFSAAQTIAEFNRELLMSNDTRLWYQPW